MCGNRLLLLLAESCVGMLLFVSCSEMPSVGSNPQMMVPDVEKDASSACLKGVTLILDNSGSMKGYQIGVKASLSGTVSDCLNKIYGEYDISTECLYGNNSYDYRTFVNKIKDGTIFTKGTTPLDDMIEQACDLASDTTVSILVSDMQLSYGIAKLRSSGDPLYNEHHITDLSAVVNTSLTTVHGRSLDIVIFRYIAPEFNGNYYWDSMENRPYIGSTMKDRPYYFLVIGSSQNLKGLCGHCCFGRYKEICSTLTFNLWECFTLSGANIHCTGNATYIGTAENQQFGIYTDDGDEDVEFEVDLGSEFQIPEYLSNETYCVFDDNGIIKSVQYIKDKQSFLVTLKPLFEIGKITGNEHLAKYETKGGFTVWSEGYKWMETYSFSGEQPSSLEQIEGKTWGLNAIWDAVERSFGNKPQVVASFDFKFVKTK